MSARDRAMTRHQYEHLREQLEFRVDAWLRERGWRHSSSHPGSFWLYEKAIDGKTYVVDKALAESIEQALQADELNALCKCGSDLDDHREKCPARFA